MMKFRILVGIFGTLTVIDAFVGIGFSFAAAWTSGEVFDHCMNTVIASFFSTLIFGFATMFIIEEV